MIDNSCEACGASPRYVLWYNCRACGHMIGTPIHSTADAVL